jgi:hypothetical protein
MAVQILKAILLSLRCLGYQNIPVNLAESQRQIGIHTEYSIMSARSA